MMRALVDVTHPAHVHLFRPTVERLADRGHDVHVASREKDVTTDLLDAHDLGHVVLSRKRAGWRGAAREWLGREARLLRFARRLDPDVIVSRLNPAAAHVSRLLDVPNVVFHDSEAGGFVDRITTPFAAVVCTPTEYEGTFPTRHLRYDGYHELAYLHPARFDPDPGPLRNAGVDPDEPYSVVRLVGMDAHHDAGQSGLSSEAVESLLDGLADHGAVYVSSEHPLTDDLADYANPVPPAAMPHLLAFADTYVGDSTTMATEAAVLGTPSVRYDPLSRTFGNFNSLADYGLVYSSDDEWDVVETAISLAGDPEAGRRWRRRRRRLLADKIDVTAFMVELVEEVGGA